MVTGGSRGLGRGMAEGLLECGAEVVIVGSSQNVYTAATELAAEVGCEGRVHAVQANLADEAERCEDFEKAVNLLGGRLDILINNAGIQRRNRCEVFKMEDWRDVIEVNLTAVFSLCQMAGRIMLKEGKGKIINVASMMSFFGGFTVPAYAASKGGIAQLTKAFSNEWASKGINVNAIAPGYMATDMNTALRNDKERNEKILARIPAGRWGKPEDMKGLAIFLSSSASDYINGAIIPADGGYLGA